MILKEAYPILDGVSDMLSNVSGSIDEIRVQGHTARARSGGNNVQRDRTLASQRATNVVVYLQENGCTVDPARLVSEGFGEWRPVAPNDTDENRAKNRRVEMIISGRDLEAELNGQGAIQQYYIAES